MLVGTSSYFNANYEPEAHLKTAAPKIKRRVNELQNQQQRTLLVMLPRCRKYEPISNSTNGQFNYRLY